MGFEFKGMKEFQKQLDNIQKQAQEAVNGKVSIGDLFSDEFMRENSEKENFQKFFDESPASGEELEELEQLNTPEMDDYVRNNTQYESWKDFAQAAANAYGANMLKKAGFKVK